MSDKLLPCPFCGGAPEISSPYRKVAICTTCAARGPIGDNPSEGWNSRAQPAPAEHVMVGDQLDEATKRKLREALRFSASRSVLTAEDEQRILSVLDGGHS